MRTAVVDVGDRSPTLPAVYGLRPAAFERFGEMYALLWRSPHVDAATVDLVRLRIAALGGCASELAIRYQLAIDAGLDETTVEALGRWTSAPEISHERRAALRFAEQYVLDPHGLDDRDFELLAEHWSPEAIATIVLATAMCDALTRFRLALGVAPVAAGVTVVAGPDPELVA